MTTAEAPPEVCHRCHGTGAEPTPKRRPTVPDEFTGGQRLVLERLAEAGERLTSVRRKRNRAALDARDAAYQDIIVHNAEARRMALPEQVIANAVGVSRKSLWQITSGQRGG